MARVLRWLLGGTAIYAALCLLAFLLQRRLLYFPERYSEERARLIAKSLGLRPWVDSRGATVGWQALPPGPPQARVLVLHGNAGSALDRDYYAAAFNLLNVEVILLEYPGYGMRAGSPSLAALGDAAAEALDDLAARGKEPIWVLGESLGSGVAARAVALRPGIARGLVLVTPFARMADLVRKHFPFLPSALLRDRFAPATDLAGYRGPAAVIIAGRDEVVGAEQGQRLFEALIGPKLLFLQEEATHNGLNLNSRAPFWREIVDFLTSNGRG